MLVREGRDSGYFENPSDATRLLDPIIAFKKSCSVVLKYQITAIPLSFVQVHSQNPLIMHSNFTFQSVRFPCQGFYFTSFSTQAVTLTVQIFGIVSLMGKQFVDFPTKLMVIDCYLPILPAMQVNCHVNLWNVHYAIKLHLEFLSSTWPIYLG